MPMPSSSEDIPWEALAAFLAGELPDGERSRVEQWLAQDPQHEALFALLQQGWQASAANRRRYDAEAALHWIKGHAQDPAGADILPRTRASARLRTAMPLREHRRVRHALLAASIAALALGGWWIIAGERALGRGTHSVATTEYHAARGRRLAFKLPDGSAVVLGPDSWLRLASNYGRSARAVELDGDGYFEVRHDAARPFSVRTRRGLVRDLGTRFVVQAYPDDQTTDVVVAEGRVALELRHPRGEHGPAAPLSVDSLVLQPGQRGRLTETGTLIATSHVPLDEYFGWVDGRLVIPDLPVAEALRSVGRWYDVRIRLANAQTEAAIRGRTVNAVFRDESAAEAVRLLAAPFALTIEQDDSGFVLRSVRK